MEVFIAALAGAFAASGLILYYNHLTQQKQLRTAATMDIVSWTDDVYDRLITVHAQRDAIFSGTPFGLSNDEYRTVVKEIKSMLLSSKMRARVAIVYGEGLEMMKFDSLHNEFIDVTDILLNASKETWGEVNIKVNERFSKVLEPLIKSLEAMFISGIKYPAISRALLAPQGPTVYLPHREKDIVMRKNEPGGAGAVKRFAAWQFAKFIDTALDVLRIVVVLCVVGSGAWLWLGRPDLSWIIIEDAAVRQELTANQPPSLRAELLVDSPRDYGIDTASGEARITKGAVLSVSSMELPVKLRLKNCRAVDLKNVVFMLSFPQEILPSGDLSWRNQWQELRTRSRNWIVLNLIDDIKPGEAMSLTPYPQIKLPAKGEYNILYKYFADNLPAVSGRFTVKTTDSF